MCLLDPGKQRHHYTHVHEAALSLGRGETPPKVQDPSSTRSSRLSFQADLHSPLSAAPHLFRTAVSWLRVNAIMKRGRGLWGG